MEKNDGGPAFPVPWEAGDVGMSLRDWFAGQALLAIGDVNPHLPGDRADPNIWPEPDVLAARRSSMAYLQADAMIAARETK